MPALVAVFALIIVIYFIFADEKKPQTIQPRMPTVIQRTKFEWGVMTLVMICLIFLPPVIMRHLTDWENSINLELFSDSDFIFLMTDMPKYYEGILAFVIVSLIIFYAYAILRRMFVFVFGIPFQCCVLTIMLWFFVTQPNSDLFQSLELDQKMYHLIQYERGLYLFDCEDNLCESELLGFLDSHFYSNGTMAYDPDNKSLRVQATGHSVEDYIIPLDN